MKLVQFTRPLIPFRPGEQRVLPDPVAQKLVADGDAVVIPSVFDAAGAVVPKPSPIHRPTRGYRTRGFRA